MILAYHELFGQPPDDIYAISAASFRRHADIVKECCGNRECLTFDDGHVSHYEIAAPILTNLQIPGAFFVTTDWISRRKNVLTWAHVRQLAELGFLIGSHSHTHRLLTQCSQAELRDELSISKRILEDQLGTEIAAISLPGGRRNACVMGACADAGYKRVYTSSVGQGKCADGQGPEIIGRFVVTSATRESTLSSYLTCRRSALLSLELKAAFREGVKRTIGDACYQWAWRKAYRARSLKPDSVV